MPFFSGTAVGSGTVEGGSGVAVGCGVNVGAALSSPAEEFAQPDKRPRHSAAVKIMLTVFLMVFVPFRRIRPILSQI